MCHSMSLIKVKGIKSTSKTLKDIFMSDFVRKFIKEHYIVLCNIF